MKKYLLSCSLLFSFLLAAFACQAQKEMSKEENWVRANYDKKEYEIPMRDGVTLYTIVYSPKDQSEKYPMMLYRTCYSLRAYGEDQFLENLGPSKYMAEEKFIFVYQDVRGRYMSGGTFDNMRPNVPGNKTKETDESSDTYDTIDWLLKNVKNHNGKAGQWGISYPGFYTAAALPDAHPALKASSPQAPIGDFFFDDFHHNGAFLQSYLKAYPVFGYQKDGKTTEHWWRDKIISDEETGADGYEFNLDLGPLSNVDEYYGEDNFFWQQVVDHPNYDEFWQKRAIVPHLEGIDHAVMTVGGWFDAEDLYGPLNIYKKIEHDNPDAFNILVMGPWSHGDWARGNEKQVINHIYFGDNISDFYQKEIELNFFRSILKENKKPDLPEAYLFDTGLKQWKKFSEWPPKTIPNTKLTFHEDGRLGVNEKSDLGVAFSYVSDPDHPVPYTSQTEGFVFTPRRYMTDDQRHASRRPDVLTFETGELKEDVTLAGEILAKLKVAISSTDADFVVKIIDVHPDDHPDYEVNPDNIKMGGYQMLVRAEVMCGRFRESFAEPKPFKANEPTDVEFRLQDMLHTFKKGHKIMVQIHSTWFPYIDRNPQKYVDNIYKAKEEDFQKAEITVYGDSEIEIGQVQTMEMLEYVD